MTWVWAPSSWPAAGPPQGLWSQWSCSRTCPTWWACRRAQQPQVSCWIPPCLTSGRSCALQAGCRTSRCSSPCSRHPLFAGWNSPSGTLRTRTEDLEAQTRKSENCLISTSRNSTWAEHSGTSIGHNVLRFPDIKGELDWLCRVWSRFLKVFQVAIQPL